MADEGACSRGRGAREGDALWKTEIVIERVEMLSGRGKGAMRDAADVVGPTIQRFVSGSRDA